MKKNKSISISNSKYKRQHLVNKISDAMCLKYGNFFSAAKYDLKTLKEDVDKIINTQYCSKDPRDVFGPIETNILDIVKKKNPQLQTKLKKVKKLPLIPIIKFKKDRYKEMYDSEKNILKTQIRQSKSKTPIRKKILNKKIDITKDNNTNIETNKSKINKTQITYLGNITLNDKNETDRKEVIKEFEPIHPLLDKLNNRIKYDPSVKLIERQKQLYEKKQQELNQKRMLEREKYLNSLKIQIEEKGKRKEEERQKELREFKEIQEQIRKENEEKKQEELNEKQKKEKIKQNFDKSLEEKVTRKKQQQIEKDKENKKIVDLMNEELINAKKNFLEQKNRRKEEILKINEINEKIMKEKIRNKKKIDIIEEPQDYIKNNSFSNNIIKDRIIKRSLEQEAASNFLLKIINSKERRNSDHYLVEREKQEQKKKLEYELADKNRRQKMNDFKQSLLDILEHKNIEKQKQKEEDEQYKKNIEEDYEQYLKEEKEKKLKQIQKYENYRKALEEQIKENKIRDIERIKYL